MAVTFLEAIIDVTKEFNPDEPRDDRGEWTAGGTGGGGAKDKGGPSRGKATPPRLGMATSYRNPYRMSHGATRAYVGGEENPKVRAQEQIRQAQAKVDEIQRQLSEASQDKSEDLYWGLHGSLQQARSDLDDLKTKFIGLFKAFNPDEARDAIGRWTSDGGGPEHPDFMDASDGYALHDKMDGVAGKMEESVSRIADAHNALYDAADEQDNISGEEDDMIEHGPQSKEYQEWEQRNSKAGEEIANKTMELRNAVADHLQATAGVLSDLDKEIQRHADMGLGEGRNVRAKS